MSTLTWSREDLAWAAGFLEGEGSFRAARSRTKSGTVVKVLDVNAVQVEREPLERLLSIFPFGKIYGPYLHKGENKQKHYRFLANRFEKAQAIIAAVWPWLSTKRKRQAKEALIEVILYAHQPKLKPGRKRKEIV